MEYSLPHVPSQSHKLNCSLSLSSIKYIFYGRWFYDNSIGLKWIRKHNVFNLDSILIAATWKHFVHIDRHKLTSHFHCHAILVSFVFRLIPFIAINYFLLLMAMWSEMKRTFLMQKVSNGFGSFAYYLPDACAKNIKRYSYTFCVWITYSFGFTDFLSCVFIDPRNSRRNFCSGSKVRKYIHLCVYTTL